MELNNKYYNIDKVNCIIKKEGQSTSVYNTKSVPKVIYKPIFYRTYDLQDINIRIGLRQNIGINLAEYMTKVDNFSLSLNGTQYREIARNDIYVIFNVDGTTLSTTSGTYYILDDGGEYISSGHWNGLMDT